MRAICGGDGMQYDYTAAKRLAMAVIIQAANDYAEVCFKTPKWAAHDWDRKRKKEQLEHFFRSGYFSVLTEDAMDGEALMTMIRQRRQEGWTPKFMRQRMLEVIE